MKTSKPIPEGYSFIRCDIYSKEEFLSMHKGEDVEGYVKIHDKETYNTDDEIALMHMRNERAVNSIGGTTTKRYKSADEDGLYDYIKKNMEE